MHTGRGGAACCRSGGVSSDCSLLTGPRGAVSESLRRRRSSIWISADGDERCGMCDDRTPMSDVRFGCGMIEKSAPAAIITLTINFTRAVRTNLEPRRLRRGRYSCLVARPRRQPSLSLSLSNKTLAAHVTAFAINKASPLLVSRHALLVSSALKLLRRGAQFANVVRPARRCHA